jgi:hypothetical protein
VGSRRPGGTFEPRSQAAGPIVSASFAPLLALLVARLAGATASAAATVGVTAAVVLLTLARMDCGPQR